MIFNIWEKKVHRSRSIKEKHTKENLILPSDSNKRKGTISKIGEGDVECKGYSGKCESSLEADMQ